MRELPMLVIVGDCDSEGAVYEQIARQIRGRIASGDLPAGAVLPSVRSVALDLRINPDTVARAWNAAPVTRRSQTALPITSAGY